MLCQECQQRQATLHIEKTENQQKNEFYLCEVCAAKKNLYPGYKAFNFNQLLSGMLELNQDAPGGAFEQETPLRCPNCGMSYDQFKELGRFGCHQCYGTFKERIQPLLRKIHGNLVHNGKIPKRRGGELSIQRKIKDLKTRMQQAVEKEDFEEAANIRDEIKALEKDL